MKCISLVYFLLINAVLYAQTNTPQASLPNAYAYKQNKNGVYKKAAVVSAHPLASAVGVMILQQGGNAFDAAVATQLALAVVYPGAGNLGGGGFMLARNKKGNVIALDYRETAPAAAHRDMYLDSAKNAQTNLSQNGHLAAGVPGTVAGLKATLPYCRLKWKQLIQPAIELAEKGFVVTEKEAAALNAHRSAFMQYNAQPVAFVKNSLWKQGDTLIQSELAGTLKRLRDIGPDEFYTGVTAKLIVSEMQRGKGLISLSDLKEYQAKHRTALKFNYRGYTVYGFPPPSSGGILLAQMLKMTEPYSLKRMGFHSKAAVQLMVEVERRAYADRAAHMGDPDYWKVPVNTLISDTYLKQRMLDYDTAHATPSVQVKAGMMNESTETTHISIADAEGNMVAVTTTLNGSYGAKTVVGGAGFLLNNEMDDFSIKPGVPNMYGAVGGEANAIMPRKRMLSSMCPTLVLKNNLPYMVVGTPGGTTIPTSVFQTIVNVIDFNMNADSAVNLPKFHHQWLPDEISAEPALNKELQSALQQMGYKFKPVKSIGRTELIIISPKGKQAAADTRGDDTAAGY